MPVPEPEHPPVLAMTPKAKAAVEVSIEGDYEEVDIEPAEEEGIVKQDREDARKMLEVFDARLKKVEEECAKEKVEKGNKIRKLEEAVQDLKEKLARTTSTTSQAKASSPPQTVYARGSVGGH